MFNYVTLNVIVYESCIHVLVDMPQNYLFLKLWRFKCIAALRAKNLRIA